MPSLSSHSHNPLQVPCASVFSTAAAIAPVSNAVIHGVVGAASRLGWEVIGFRDGFEGLLPPGDYMVLDPARTIGIMKLGGTILGTTNKGHFVAKMGEGDIAARPPGNRRQGQDHPAPPGDRSADRRWRRRQPDHRFAALSAKAFQ